MLVVMFADVSRATFPALELPLSMIYKHTNPTVWTEGRRTR